MLRITTLALAGMIAATTLVPSIATASDIGPCDHCTMEPIVIKGERPTKDESKSPSSQIKANQPAKEVVKTRK